MTAFPVRRLRRLRQSPALRRLVAETDLSPRRLVLPVFVKEDIAEAQPIASMPGVHQYPLARLAAVVEEAAAAGIGGIMLFGVPAVRDAVGSGATDPDGILNRAIAVGAAAAKGRLTVQADLCLDEFTDHGHCGVLAADGSVDNDATLEVYARMALAQAEAGADILGLSGMMDGQVAACRAALDAAGRSDVVILAYSAKYASAFYGPFRDAVGSAASLGKADKKTYQMDPANGDEALREIALDLEEGADMVMVKPGMPYLDLVRRVKETFGVPTFAYQVSGEYAMMKAAFANGWLDERACVLESLLGFKRAGADGVLTYFAPQVARWLRER